MSMPLAVRKNISNNEGNIKQVMEKLNSEGGLGEWEFDFDFAAAYALLKSKNSYFADQVGSAVIGYVSTTVESLLSFCRRSPLQKEAVLESVKSKKLVLQLVPNQFKASSGYPNLSANVRVNVDKEQLVMTVPIERFGSGFDINPQNLETAFDPPGEIPLTTRRDIADNQPNFEQHLEKLKEPTGFDWEFDCDYAQALKTLNSKDTSGDSGRRLASVIDSYLGALVNSIVRFCQDPLQKEAFLDGTSAHKITFSFVPAAFKTPGNQHVRTCAEGGVLTIQVPAQHFGMSTDNVGDTLRVCFDDPKNPMTLLARLNIAEYNPKKEEILEKIKESTGVEYELEVDYAHILEEWSKQDKNATGGSTNRIGELMQVSYLGALSESIERVCRDSMGKEAFVEATPKRVIRLQVYPTLKKGEPSFYNRCKLEDGALVCEFYVNNIQTDVSSAGRNIDKLL